MELFGDRTYSHPKCLDHDQGAFPNRAGLTKSNFSQSFYLIIEPDPTDNHFPILFSPRHTRYWTNTKFPEHSSSKLIRIVPLSFRKSTNLKTKILAWSRRTPTKDLYLSNTRQHPFPQRLTK